VEVIEGAVFLEEELRGANQVSDLDGPAHPDTQLFTTAARHALSLDRYDKDSQALVQKLESQ